MGELVQVRLNPHTVIEVDVERVDVIAHRAAHHPGYGDAVSAAILIHVRGRGQPFYVIPNAESIQQVQRITDLKNNPEGITP